MLPGSRSEEHQMSHPTSSALTGIVPSAGTSKRKLAGKRPQYKAPTILTYSDDQLLREMRPTDGAKGPRSRRV